MTPTVEDKIKAGIKTTEFYLATLVTVAGAIVQFLPDSIASSVVKGIAIVSALLSAAGYTASRTIVKTNNQ